MLFSVYLYFPPTSYLSFKGYGVDFQSEGACYLFSTWIFIQQQLSFKGYGSAKYEGYVV